jgi:DNA-binding LacI/PurR family transcriptional regulator
MNSATSVPLYKRIKSEIVDRIGSGELGPGQALPTRTELASQYSTTKATVDRAMQELARDGVVVAGSGRRTLVLNRAQIRASSIAVVWSAPEEHISRAGGDFFGPLIGGIRQACAEFQLEVHFRATQLASYADVIEETGAQGLLVLRPDYGDVTHLERLIEQGIPVVTAPGIMEAGHIASVSSDNYLGMEQAISHLVSLGHQHIAFVCLTATIPDHFERLQGFISAMARSNLQINPKWLCLTHASTADEFAQHCRRWLTVDQLPTAIITSDFLMGLAVLRGLSDRHVHVPSDVSLMSFDDPPAAAHVVPAMSVVKQQVSMLAYRGVERLVQRIQHEEIPLVNRIPTELIVRESTMQPRSTRL